MLRWISAYLPLSEAQPQQAAKVILLMLEGENELNILGHEDVVIEGIEFLFNNA